MTKKLTYNVLTNSSTLPRNLFEFKQNYSAPFFFEKKFVIFLPNGLLPAQLSQLEELEKQSEVGREWGSWRMRWGKSWLPSRKCMVWLQQRPPDSSWGRGRALLGDGCWAGVAMRGCCCLPCSDVQEGKDSILVQGACADGPWKPWKKINCGP